MLYLFTKSQRKRLKYPFGPILRKVPRGLRGSRIISIGDIATLSLLKGRIRPFLAVFDFRTRRRKLDKKRRKTLEKSFDSFYLANNPPGFLSSSVIKIAKEAMKDGGSVVIDGEEDLTLLAFMKFARKEDIFIYGMPGLGFCLVEGKKGKRIAESFIKKAKRVASAPRAENP
ncbi:MAG: DUF359 domain-containing protein [Candidatus Micrarchaeota archaeon]|nr:DUF359 domain-containing protein [Candidatus Micrarchaeota archaeon]